MMYGGLDMKKKLNNRAIFAIVPCRSMAATMSSPLTNENAASAECALTNRNIMLPDSLPARNSTNPTVSH